MFLVNKLSKMKHKTPLGSRIAEVHNGSSLFTGDAGQGESNVRRWIFENDWLEAIIALPLNMFYNTGIATGGAGPHLNFNAVKQRLEAALDTLDISLRAAEFNNLWSAFTTKDAAAEAVIKKKTKKSVELEPDPDLRDTEQVPLLEKRGIEAFFQREVLPHVPDAWIDHSKTVIGYEISFTRHFFKPQPLRSLEEIRADLEALQAEAEGLLDQIIDNAAMGAK